MYNSTDFLFVLIFFITYLKNVQRLGLYLNRTQFSASIYNVKLNSMRYLIIH